MNIKVRNEGETWYGYPNFELIEKENKAYWWHGFWTGLYVSLVLVVVGLAAYFVAVILN